MEREKHLYCIVDYDNHDETTAIYFESDKKAGEYLDSIQSERDIAIYRMIDPAGPFDPNFHLSADNMLYEI